MATGGNDMIFLDVDDTLILYDDTHKTSTKDVQVHLHGVLKGERFTVNDELVERVMEFAAGRGEAVVVWSGGGADYARMVVKSYVPRLTAAPSVHYLTKDEWSYGIVSPGDIVVDDLQAVRTILSAAGAKAYAPRERWFRSSEHQAPYFDEPGGSQ